MSLLLLRKSVSAVVMQNAKLDAQQTLAVDNKYLLNAILKLDSNWNLNSSFT
jgi:hypothetical protein